VTSWDYFDRYHIPARNISTQSKSDSRRLPFGSARFLSRADAVRKHRCGYVSPPKAKKKGLEFYAALRSNHMRGLVQSARRKVPSATLAIYCFTGRSIDAHVTAACLLVPLPPPSPRIVERRAIPRTRSRFCSHVLDLCQSKTKYLAALVEL
jgi:hypothetical protein